MKTFGRALATIGLSAGAVGIVYVSGAVFWPCGAVGIVYVSGAVFWPCIALIIGLAVIWDGFHDL